MLPLKPANMLTSDYSNTEEILSASSHLLGFVLSLIGLSALVLKAESAIQTSVVSIYGVSLVLMFLSSSLYHSIREITLKTVLQKIDHTAIFLLIAGSYTPFMVYTVSGKLGIVSLVLIWSIAALGISFKLLSKGSFPKISIITYALMGWLAVFVLYPIYQNISAAGFSLLLIGGLCYSAGIPFYLMKKRHYTHAIWHAAVLLGASCHFFAVYFHVL